MELGEGVLSPQLGQIIGAVASVRYSKAKQPNAGQNSNDTEPSNGSAFPDSKQNAGQGQGDKAGGGGPNPNSRQWDNWQPPAGYTRNADGTVTHGGSGQIYTPVRDASGNVRFDSRGNPVFNTQSAGSTAQTTLTQPSTSGPVINAPGPNAALPIPRRVGSLQGGPLENATQVSGRFSLENGLPMARFLGLIIKVTLQAMRLMTPMAR
ncbi:hypothetical protein V6L77_01000 [Pannonibacter sp. Pt2-lr]